MLKNTLLICWGLVLTLSMSRAALAQTCQASSIPAATQTARFTLHGDGTVTDIATGLTWKQCSEGQSGADCATGRASTWTWKGAFDQAVALNGSGGFAGHTDWRVPNNKELESLVEEQCVNPSINLTVFPNTPNDHFWSSTPYASGRGEYVLVVHFGIGEAGGAITMYSSRYVRLVRGGQ